MADAAWYMDRETDREAWERAWRDLGRRVGSLDGWEYLGSSGDVHTFGKRGPSGARTYQKIAGEVRS